MPKVEQFVVMTDRDHMAGAAFPARSAYEDPGRAALAPTCAWGGFDENTACGLCYTSGTTGNPKGVLYSHRSNFLHTLVTLQADVMGLSSRDVDPAGGADVPRQRLGPGLLAPRGGLQAGHAGREDGRRLDP